MTDLVSIIIPTRNRPSMLWKAVEYALCQQWIKKEIILAVDGIPIPWKIPQGIKVLYFAAFGPITIGEKLNRAVAASTGKVIVRFDDDDWYGPGRVAAQVIPILEGKSSFNRMDMGHVLEMSNMRFWAVKAGHPSNGVTAFSRKVWEHVKFRDISRGEDTCFVRDAAKKGFQVTRVLNNGHFVYSRHGKNISAFSWGMKTPIWWIVPKPDFFPMRDFLYYKKLFHSKDKR